jgi:hypothetical protein
MGNKQCNMDGCRNSINKYQKPTRYLAKIQYCNKHICKEQYCVLPVNGCNYCVFHKCSVYDCPRPRSYGQYCAVCSKKQ